MNKNIIIGILVAVFIIGGGYLLVTSNQNTTTVPDSTTATNPTNPITPTPTVPVAVVPPLTLGAPSIETNPNASASISSALVTGTVTPKGTETTYWFDYGLTTGLGSRTIVQQIGSGFLPISSPAYIVGLRADTAYYYRLSATNNFGTVNGATFSFRTNNNPAPKASLPTARTGSATNVLSATANLNGQVNPNGWQTNYWFEYGKDNKFGNMTSITSVNGSTSPSSVSGSLSGLAPSTKYFFRLFAQNQFGTVSGSTLNFTTKN